MGVKTPETTSGGLEVKPTSEKKITDYQIVDFKRRVKASIDAINLRDMVNANIIITKYAINNDNQGREYALILDEKGNKFYTYSKVVIKQLRDELADILQSGKAVRVSVRKTKKYLYLDEPIR